MVFPARRAAVTAMLTRGCILLIVKVSVDYFDTDR